MVDAVLGGKVRMWGRGGLAENLGWAVFTGDGVVSGLIHQSRLERIHEHFDKKECEGAKAMMRCPTPP